MWLLHKLWLVAGCISLGRYLLRKDISNCLLRKDLGNLRRLTFFKIAGFRFFEGSKAAIFTSALIGQVGGSCKGGRRVGREGRGERGARRIQKSNTKSR